MIEKFNLEEMINEVFNTMNILGRLKKIDF